LNALIGRGPKPRAGVESWRTVEVVWKESGNGSHRVEFALSGANLDGVKERSDRTGPEISERRAEGIGQEH
jgi:hypothetical protein